MRRLASPTHRTLKLDEILRLVEQSNFGLPDFQRQFVWEQDKLRRLLATVFMGWPAGMVLLMEAPPENFFAVRALDGVPGQDSGQFRHLILDGQQRVTALAHAFGLVHSLDRGRWYVDVEKFTELLPEGDVEDSFVRLTRESAAAPSRRLIPLSALRSGADFQEWRNDLLAEQSDNDFDHRWDRSSTDHAWVELLAGVRAFELPCTILPAGMPLPAVAMIFERLNTAGIALDTFDLVVAHVYKDGHNLRDEWNRALDSRPNLRNFASGDALIAAELISMITTGDTRRAGLLSLDPEQLWSAWPRAISALEDAVQFLTDEAGIAKAGQLPHRGFLLALAGASYELGGLPMRLKPLILHWLYTRGLASRFNAAVNTRVVSEYRILVRALSDGQLPNATPSVEELCAATRRTNASTWLTFQAMIRRNRPESYPDGLVAVPMPPEWAVPKTLVAASASSIAELALSTILGDGPVFRTLGEFRQSLTAFERARVDRYLEEQLLPSLDSTAWDVQGQFIGERARLALAQLAELNQAAQRLFQVQAPARVVEHSSGAQPRGRPNSRYESMRDTFQLADYLIQQGRSHDATSVLQLLLETRVGAPINEIVDAELLLARALVGSGYASQALHLLRASLQRIDNEQLSGENSHARQKVIQTLAELLRGAGSERQAIEASRTEWFRYLSEGLSRRAATEMLLHYAQSLHVSGDRETANRLAHEVLATIGDESHGQWEDLRRRATTLERESSLPDIAHGIGEASP